MPVEENVQSPGAVLAVRDYGGDGQIVLLLHGGPGFPDYLEPVADLLVPMGLRPVRFDQRGAGTSATTNGRYEPLNYISDVEAVRRHLTTEPVHIFGHSWGGLLGQLYLARHPDQVRSLFLCSSAPGVGSEWRTKEREVFEFNRERAGAVSGLAMGIASIGLRLPLVADASARALMARVWRNYFPDPKSAPALRPSVPTGLHARAIRDSAKALRKADPHLLDGIGDLDLPVLVEFGGDDIYQTAAYVLRRRFPNARHEVLTESGHLPWLQDPENFAVLLLSFYEGGH